MAFMRSIRYIVVHHSATLDNSKLSMDDIRHYHMQVNGWSEIGYHYVIEQVEDDVIMISARPLHLEGAHAPGRNKDSIGVCLVGDFDEAPPTSLLWRESVRRINDLMIAFNVPVERVLGHKEATLGRTCPGRFFNIEGLRKALKEEG